MMMEDVEHPLAVADLDPEPLAGVLVRDRHDDPIVALTPEQPDIGPVGGAVVERWNA
jgi:hypothetical protein